MRLTDFATLDIKATVKSASVRLRLRRLVTVAFRRRLRKSYLLIYLLTYTNEQTASIA